jgi:hypothetical protein
VFDIEARVTIVEGRVGVHQMLLTDYLETLRLFEGRVDARFTAVDARFAAIDARFVAMDARFAQVDLRFGQIDARLATLDQKVDGLGRELATHFRWTAGIMLTGLVAILAAILAQ